MTRSLLPPSPPPLSLSLSQSGSIVDKARPSADWLEIRQAIELRDPVSLSRFHSAFREPTTPADAPTTIATCVTGVSSDSMRCTKFSLRVRAGVRHDPHARDKSPYAASTYDEMRDESSSYDQSVSRTHARTHGISLFLSFSLCERVRG